MVKLTELITMMAKPTMLLLALSSWLLLVAAPVKSFTTTATPAAHSSCIARRRRGPPFSPPYRRTEAAEAGYHPQLLNENENCIRYYRLYPQPSSSSPSSLLLTAADKDDFENDDNEDDYFDDDDDITDIFTTPDADYAIQETALHRFRRRKTKILQKRKAINTAWLFSLWYILCVFYNLFSKRVLNMAPQLAWTTAFLQMAGGLTYVLPLWFLLNVRPPPRRLSFRDVKRLAPVAVLHSLVHIGGVVSMGAGAVSFTYIVKASEPAVSAVLLALTGSFLYWSVYLTLIPVIMGVAMVSVSELTFSWKSFNYAMMSNLASSSRALVGKKRINQRLGENMTAMNLYAVLTIMSSLLIAPIALFMERNTMLPALQQLAASHQLTSWLVQNYLASLFYYTYNEVAFLCLDNISPVSHAIANVVKRVFIIVSSMLVFGNKMTLQGYVGSVLAIGGVLVYSLEKNRHKKKRY